MTRAPAFICGAFIAAYFALCLSQINYGIASLDAHGIIRVVQTLIDHHKIDISRPPGHPTTEFYLFGAIAWILHWFGHSLGERVYLLGQAVAAAATLALFYNLLRKLNVRAWPACIAVGTLGFSAQFFANAIDGEEFIFALFFVLLAVRLLLGEQPVRLARLTMSIFAFALATGCRPELIFASVIYPVYFACGQSDRRRVACAVVTFAVAIAIVWLPVFVAGVHPPYDARMNFKQALLVGGYKLLFQCFGLAVAILLFVVLGRSVLQLRKRWRETFPQNFVAALACLLPLLFFALFFRYATKPAYVLVALPFLLVMATEWRALLFAIAAFSAVEFFIKIDIFQDRQLTAPHFAQGSGVGAIRQKPFYRLDYLRAAAAECGDEPTLIIADAAAWDFEYHIARGTFPAEEKLDAMERIPAFTPRNAAWCVMMPRDASFAREMLEKWRGHGYKLKMDALVFHTAFARYDAHARNESQQFEIFTVKE